MESLMNSDIHRLYIDEAGVLSSTDPRKALDRMYGAGGWELDRKEIIMPPTADGVIYYWAALRVDDKVICEATGEHRYASVAGRICYATGIDLAKQDCLRKMCTKLGILKQSDLGVPREEIVTALRVYNGGLSRGVRNGMVFTAAAAILVVIIMITLSWIAEVR